MVPLKVLLSVGLMLFGAACILGMVLFEKRRVRKLRAICEQLGLQFHPKDDGTLMDAMSHFPLFSQGHGKKIRNVFHGETEEMEVAIFGYQYATSSGNNHNTVRQSVVYFRTPGSNLPQFTLRPEGLLHKIGQALGYRDIDFESHPTFSKKYLLRAEDEEAARSVFNGEVLSHFEQHLGINIEAAGNQLIYYRAGRRVRPDKIRSFMEEGFQVAKLFRQ